jgi:hypothetical protein
VDREPKSPSGAQKKSRQTLGFWRDFQFALPAVIEPAAQRQQSLRERSALGLLIRAMGALLGLLAGLLLPATLLLLTRLLARIRILGLLVVLTCHADISFVNACSTCRPPRGSVPDRMGPDFNVGAAAKWNIAPRAGRKSVPWTEA